LEAGSIISNIPDLNVATWHPKNVQNSMKKLWALLRDLSFAHGQKMCQ
jgi:hypothetical protein